VFKPLLANIFQILSYCFTFFFELADLNVAGLSMDDDMGGFFDVFDGPVQQGNLEFYMPV